MSIFKKIWHTVKHAAKQVAGGISGSTENQGLEGLEHETEDKLAQTDKTIKP